MGVGLGLKMQKRDDDPGTGRIILCFFGDGAANLGPFHESLNMAAIWKLPVVFVCENNQYAMSFPVKKAFAIERISDRAAAYGMPGETVDGNDVLAVYGAVGRAVARARGRRGTVPGRERHLSLARPLQERRQPLSHPRGDRGLEGESARSCAFVAAWWRREC